MTSPHEPNVFTPSERTHELLAASLRKIAAGRAPELGDSLCELAKHACADARKLDLPIERLIVEMKHRWERDALAHGVSGRDGTAVLDRLVSACIREYYRPG